VILGRSGNRVVQIVSAAFKVGDFIVNTLLTLSLLHALGSVPGLAPATEILNQEIVRCDIAVCEYFCPANWGTKKRQMEISKC
jgi:hypothetical protein